MLTLCSTPFQFSCRRRHTGCGVGSGVQTCALPISSGKVVSMSVIGCVGTLIGPIVGAAFMLYFENVVQGFIGEQWKLALGLIFVLIVIFLPGGFADLSRRLWRLAGHRIRGRRHNVPDMAPTADPDRPRHRTDREDAEA